MINAPSDRYRSYLVQIDKLRTKLCHAFHNNPGALWEVATEGATALNEFIRYELSFVEPEVLSVLQQACGNQSTEEMRPQPLRKKLLKE